MAAIQADVEAALDEKEYLPGFADFSHFIASDHSLSIYRKFAVLGARNLLYLQAELQLLEINLQELDVEDKRTIATSSNDLEKIKVEKGARSWEELKEQADEGNEKQAGKLRIIYRIRKLMQEYEEALLRRNEVLRLEKPEKSPFNAFKTWFRRRPPVLWGSGFRLLHDEEDMIALGSQDEPDRMSALMHRCLGYRLRVERETPRSWGPMYYYPVERVAFIVGLISILVSAALLVGAIMSLHFVKPMGIRLGLVGIFTTLFAASITLLTHARRIEVYGATAAYAAVLVVFISVNN
ncbi:uncharacterized protein K444DRAFT_550925 [Hyaloscypha bicolor E]|uniref:DUF6594 domain-containing protein n=1 Tax=Hyaloscypha bicolor E TaxID=1095630 RepID=A0A2J6TWW6_9HELO|nr:uncharacterized protein K444DRAFT_550925 [Hyaloscypha bicolor E]PMD67495.1 hypothetical protein K444DRAFT_550925 [Hyaloscypha bicolor E]